MDSLSDAYEDRNTATGLQKLYPDAVFRRLERLRDGPGSVSRLFRRRPRRRDRETHSRWLWFTSPTLRHYVVGALVVLGIALDAVMTDLLLAGAPVVEGNQLMQAAYDSLGIYGILGVKVSILVLGVTIFRLVTRRKWAEWMMFWFYAACGVGWTLGGLWNLLLAVLLLGYI